MLTLYTGWVIIFVPFMPTLYTDWVIMLLPFHINHTAIFPAARNDVI